MELMPWDVSRINAFGNKRLKLWETKKCELWTSSFGTVDQHRGSEDGGAAVGRRGEHHLSWVRMARRGAGGRGGLADSRTGQRALLLEPLAGR